MNKEELREYIDTEILRFSVSSKLPRKLQILKLVHLSPSCCAIYYIRKMQYYAEKNGIFAKYLAKRYHMKLVKEFGMHIAFNAKIGIGLHLPHPTSIVIGNRTVIGKNCSIYQNCTVGGARVGDVKKGNQPVIGDNVTFFAGSMVLGKVLKL